MRDARKCSICDTVYSFCSNCSDYDHLPRWMSLFHDENCKNFWETMNLYRTGVDNAETTKQKLDKLDLSMKDSLSDTYKKLLKEIDEKVKANEHVKTDDRINTDNHDKQEERPKQIKPIYGKKKK